MFVNSVSISPICSAVPIFLSDFHSNLISCVFSQLEYPVYWTLKEWCEGFRKLLDHMQLDKVHSRDHFVYAPSQWETTLQCNVVSHWLGALTKWSLYIDISCSQVLSWQAFSSNSTTISLIRRTQSPNINVSRLVLQLSLPNPLKLCVQLRMKM